MWPGGVVLTQLIPQAANAPQKSINCRIDGLTDTLHSTTVPLHHDDVYVLMLTFLEIDTDFSQLTDPRSIPYVTNYVPMLPPWATSLTE